jgi:DNA-binding transcriptional MerR regulator
MATYTIKELEKLSGIKAHTIRIWEKRYGLLEPGRTGTNIRYYSDEDLKKILNISLLNRNGMKISHIAGLPKEQISDKVMHVTRESNDFDTIIDQMIIAMVELDKMKFEKVFSRVILQVGFEETIERAIYPFLEKIGILWMTGAINPAQEHFVTNLIRQKLIVAIDELIIKPNPSPKSFLLYLPEGELHELGLLYSSYLIQKKGHNLTYLGQWVPLKDMMEAATVIPVDYIFTSIVNVHSGEDLSSYLHKLSLHFPDKEILVTGYQTMQLAGKLPEKITRLQSIEELESYL